jgi:hypothetical protein
MIFPANEPDRSRSFPAQNPHHQAQPALGDIVHAAGVEPTQAAMAGLGNQLARWFDFADLLDGHPQIHEVIRFDCHRFLAGMVN